MDKNIVYHYCNINTFYSIISNKTLRLSDITKSNDQLEITWANNIIRDVFRYSYYDLLKDEIKKELKEEDYMKHIEEKITLYFEQNELRNKFFAICFSGQNSGDLLSQWRGYGDDGQGIAIGFNEYVFKKIRTPIQMYESKKQQCILYNKVIYDKANQEKKIQEVVTYFLDKLNCQSNEEFGIYNRLESILLECFPRLYQEAIFMKNPFFKEEDESRLVICEGESNEKNENNKFINSKKKYYIRNNQLIGYYDISLKEIKKQEILKMVVIGPKSNLDKSTLLSFLQDNSFMLQEEKIQYSKGSYQ